MDDKKLKELSNIISNDERVLLITLLKRELYKTLYNELMLPPELDTIENINEIKNKIEIKETNYFK